MTDYFKPERFMCQDCGHDVREMGEMFMLFDWCWAYVCRRKKTDTHMLCIGCVEERLGWTLTRDWFSSAPQNFDWNSHQLGPPYCQSLRLRQRLRSSHRMMIQGDPSNDPHHP